MFRKSSGVTVIAILTMALGIGATTAIFSVVDATLLRPLPYAEPEQLVSIQADLPGLGANDVGISQPEWQDLQESGIFQYVSPTWFDENNLTGSSQPARVRLLLVAPNYFALLAVQPQLGRAFDPQDHSPGIIPEVVISDGLWKRSFGADSNILGKSVRMDTDLYRIVGVMPAGFDAPGLTRGRKEHRNLGGEQFLRDAYARPSTEESPLFPDGNSPAEARSNNCRSTEQLDALTASLQKQFPGDYPPQNAWTVRLLPLKERWLAMFASRWCCSWPPSDWFS